MGAVLWVSAMLAAPLLDVAGLRYAVLAGVLALGAAAYFGLGAPLGAFRLAEIKASLRR